MLANEKMTSQEADLEDANDPLLYYARQGVMTDPGEHGGLFRDLPTSIPALCEVVQGLLIHPLEEHLYNEHTSGMRRRELQLRTVARKLARKKSRR